jgi:hypothetical protein
MNKLKSLALASAMAAGMAGSVAAGVLFECDMVTDNPNGWVSPKAAFVFDDAGQVTVIDSVILNFLGKPIPAQVRRNNGKLRVTWNISGAKDSKGQSIPKIRYIAEIAEASGAIRIIAKPTRAPQRWSKTGTCKKRTAAK